MVDFDKYIENSHFMRWTGKLHCSNGHTWIAAMFNEYGGMFFKNDDEGCCPECKQEYVGDIETAKED